MSLDDNSTNSSDARDATGRTNSPSLRELVVQATVFANDEEKKVDDKILVGSTACRGIRNPTASSHAAGTEALQQPGLPIQKDLSAKFDDWQRHDEAVTFENDDGGGKEEEEEEKGVVPQASPLMQDVLLVPLNNDDDAKMTRATGTVKSNRVVF